MFRHKKHKDKSPFQSVILLSKLSFWNILIIFAVMDKELIISKIINACFHVHVVLMPGYLESVYRNALEVELKLLGFTIQSEVPLDVIYKGHIVGEFRADIVVENSIIIELKAVSQLTVQHELQLVNYLTCTGIDDGILVNFGSEKLQIKRKFKNFQL